MGGDCRAYLHDYFLFFRLIAFNSCVREFYDECGRGSEKSSDPKRSSKELLRSWEKRRQALLSSIRIFASLRRVLLAVQSTSPTESFSIPTVERTIARRPCPRFPISQSCKISQVMFQVKCDQKPCSVCPSLGQDFPQTTKLFETKTSVPLQMIVAGKDTSQQRS